MGKSRTDIQVEQYTEAESRQIYDLMLSNGRIIQVTSGGVRVFYKTTMFSNEEVLKARRVFPLIDLQDNLDGLLDRLYGRAQNDADVKHEIIEAVYRPIKKEIDEILIDSRRFLADNAAMAKIRTDLNNVIRNLDGLTLNMLNKVLNDDESQFKRNIEFAVYSGLISSVIFGDFKTHKSDKKVVEDIILIAMAYSSKDNATLKKQMFSRFEKGDSTKHYKLEQILSETGDAESNKRNIISEILFVSERYTEILHSTEHEPIKALITLQNEMNEDTAIGIGALFTKYTIREYRNQYKHLEEKSRESLAISEDKLRVHLMRRMIDAPSAISKLAEFFIEDIMIKQTYNAGFQRVLDFKECHTLLSGIKQNSQNYFERLGAYPGETYRIIERLMRKSLDAIETLNSEYSLVKVNADASIPDEGILSCLSMGSRYKDIDFIIGYTAGNLIHFGEECSQIYRMNQQLELRRNFSAINESLRKLRRFLPRAKKEIHNVTKIVDIITNKLKDGPGLRIIKGIPSEPICASIDPFQLGDFIATLIDNALEAIESQMDSQDASNPERSKVNHINIIVRQQKGFCRIKVQDSGGGMNEEVYNSLFVQHQPYGPLKKGQSLLKMQEYIDQLDGASLDVQIKEGAGTTFEVSLKIPEGRSDIELQGIDIITALKERHWNI